MKNLRGKAISAEILKAIEELKFAILILSKNYASSTWCLDELAKIISYKKRDENDSSAYFSLCGTI